jgi:hypothetical protein
VSHHFAFSRVLSQVTPVDTLTPTITTTPVTATPTLTITSTATFVPNTPIPSGTPGVPCTTVIGGQCTVTGGVTGTYTKTGAGGTFTFTTTAPAGALAGTPVIFIPTTANAAGEQFQCTSIAGAGAVVTCTGTTAGDPLLGATVTVVFPGNVIQTGVVTGAANVNLSLAQAQTSAQATGGFLLGSSLIDCAPVGQTCQVTGAVTGTITITGSFTFTLTTTVPAGATPTIPVAVFSTDAGIIAVACGTAAGAVGTTYTCTGAAGGPGVAPQQGSTVAICFATNAAATTATCNLGTVTGPGVISPLAALNLPLLPPPPLQFLPPPPPPLLPPPPMAPPMGMGMRAPAAFPEVPVIPEADSLFLLVGGLVALGSVVALRRLRRERPE